MQKPQCVYVHDDSPTGTVDAVMLAPGFAPSEDDESVLECVAWSPVCEVDSWTWYDGSDVPEGVQQAHPFVRFA